MVKAQTSLDKLVVTADGEGVVSHAGSALLVALADRVGLTAALSEAMAPTRQRVSAHDPGVVLRDLAAMLADGGDCLSDLGALRDQKGLFGAVASDSTAYRVIDSIDAAGLERLRDAVALARSRAWALGAAPKLVVLDFDATLLEAFSRKQRAAGTFKKGFGHHPLLCYLDGPGRHWPGCCATATPARTPPPITWPSAIWRCRSCPPERLTVRSSRAWTARAPRTSSPQWCRDAQIKFSVGAALTQDVLTEAPIVEDQAWKQALCQDGSENPDAWVCELTARVNLAAWPAGGRLICRAVRLAEGTQLGFGQTDGFRYEVFLTDLPGDIRDLDLFQRGHARVEDRIRDAKDCGLANLPFQSFANNEVWLLLAQLAQDLLAWSQALLLTGDLQRAEPKTLRYRLWHTAARIARHARRTHLRLDRHWPWAGQLAAAFARLQALPRT